MLALDAGVPKMVAIPEEGSVWPLIEAVDGGSSVMLMHCGWMESGPMGCDSVRRMLWTEHRAADAEAPVMSGSSL